jgi:cysteine desulfurase / selenocysteine lyase
MSTSQKETVITLPRARKQGFDVDRIRQDFPALHQEVRGKPLVYLDNAATTQKPKAVIEALEHYYRLDNANVHRGVHTLSERATAAYEGARSIIREFINARSTKEIVFVRGATEAINLVAQTWGRENIRQGDEIIITEMEHHSNIVPWQHLCRQLGATLRVAPINDAGELIIEAYEELLNERTKLVGIAQCSNALGTINPIKELIAMAHRFGARVLVDGAQAVPHMSVDVQGLAADFYVFSGHKVYGPTGIGVLYGREELLDAMPPYQFGGEMIKYVSFEKTIYNDLPYKFEAGTPHIAGAIGLGAAINYLRSIGFEAITAYEEELLHYATARANDVPGLRIIGTAANKASILSFEVSNIHPHDIGTILDYKGVAIRTGHHCAMPVMQHYCVPATARASFALYNTRQEVDSLINALGHVIEAFK